MKLMKARSSVAMAFARRTFRQLRKRLTKSSGSLAEAELNKARELERGSTVAPGSECYPGISSRVKRPSSPSRRRSSTSSQWSAHSFFQQYRDEDEAILEDGMERLCNDMEVDPCDVRMLALAWRLNAAEMCRFSQEEFVTVCEELGAYSAAELGKQLTGILYEARRHFKDFYRYAFRFGVSDGQRSLPCDVAVQLWSLVLPVCSGDGERFMNDWLEYLTSQRVKGISKDCWMVFLEFTLTVEKDFSNYSAEDSWPSLLDEFVMHQRSVQPAVESVSV
ncbi:DCN1-like protein 3 [Sycon ciliatum]|uniref:DCN1-like protein 3 n=1 Tax=Sycon ciliatum TaxID=27933 RepID=UPI0020A8BD88|eukprot:scpid53317/ scgid23395/ DCN1-like protein 3; DCUN1 domain-containing protein 3; Defective in cullin neddylation protein 1-like protein 3